MKFLLLPLILLGLKGGVFDPPRAAPDFSLDGSDGRALELSRYRGRVVALGFGFTHCEYVCPTTLSTLAKARKKLGASGKDVQVIYVTVDPERDSAEQMRGYLAGFDPSFIGATGAPDRLKKVREEYGIVASGKDHSSFVYLIDRAGKLRALMPYGHSAEDFAHDMAVLLKQ